MSQSPENRPSDDSVDLSKRAAKPTAEPTAEPAPASGAGAVPRPRTIEFVVYLLGFQILMGVVTAVAIRAMSSGLTDYYFAHYSKKGGGKYDRASAADRAEIAKAVHDQQTGAVLGAIVFGLALAALAFSLRRYRSASVARWAIVVLMIFNGGPINVIPVSGLPAGLNTIRVVVGLAWIAILVLLFVPDSRAYFKACREAALPVGAGGPRPGLRDLFAGRGALTRSTPATPPPPAPERPAGRPKAKSRADEAAVAKGAELARNRAKASKSRKTDV